MSNKWNKKEQIESLTSERILAPRMVVVNLLKGNELLTLPMSSGEARVLFIHILRSLSSGHLWREKTIK